MNSHVGGKFVYFFNSDLSGNVCVCDNDGTRKAFVEIPAEDIIAIVGEWLQRQAIVRLERMTGREFLESEAGE